MDTGRGSARSVCLGRRDEQNRPREVKCIFADFGKNALHLSNHY